MIEALVNAQYPCEIYHEIMDTVTYKSSRRQIETHHVEGVGVTTIVDRVMGFASTQNMDNLEETYNLSIRLAHAGSTYRELPQPSPLPAVSSCYDPRITEGDILDMAEHALEEVPSYCRVIDEAVTLKTQEVHILNSNGVDVKKKATFAVLDIILQDRTCEDLIFYSCFYSRTHDLCWPLAEEIEQWHTFSQDTKDVESKDTDVIFSPVALSRILDVLFQPVICGNLSEANTILQNVSSDITVYDDGTYEGGMGTSPFDGEGVPQKVTPILKEGVFKTILYDTTRASTHDTKSTGNAYRESFEDVPQVYVTNLFIPSVRRTEELMSTMKEGIFINDIFGANITHPPSGEFTVHVSSGYKIQRGEITGIIPPKMIEGTISSLFRDFTPGDDLKMVDHYIVPSSRSRVRVC